MNPKARKRTRQVLVILHCLIVFLFLLVALVPFLNPGTFWFISVLGLGYPFLLVAVIICLLISALFKSRWAFLSLIALLISWKQISVVFAFHTGKEFVQDKPENSLRVMTWNVSRWTENKNSVAPNYDNSYRDLMMDVVELQTADVLCFQEFFQSHLPKLYRENIGPIVQKGYPYYYFSPSSLTVNGKFQTGLAIFSKYPITDSLYIQTVSGGHSEGFSYADISFQGQAIRIFNTHLESPGFSRTDYTDLGKTESSRSIFSKLKRSYQLRGLQADMLSQYMQASPHPVIFCGDVDDVPNSYAYFKVKGDLKDAYLRKGSGIGRTFRFMSPTLRIDYIFADKKFDVLQVNKINFAYSDHFAVIADLELNK
jgi:endonuclease/exonuclease/phosphatase family metal-dependent hydrolase